MFLVVRGFEEQVDLDPGGGVVGDPCPIVSVDPASDDVKGNWNWDGLRGPECDRRGLVADSAIGQLVDVLAEKLLLPGTDEGGLRIDSFSGPRCIVLEINDGVPVVLGSVCPIHFVGSDADGIGGDDTGCKQHCQKGCFHRGCLLACRGYFLR